MALIDENLRYHLHVTDDMVGKYVILPGDPGRVPKIAQYLDNAEQVAYNREYNTYTGYLLGEKVSVVSTGIGGPSTAIAVEELIKSGAHTFVRIGTSGGINMKVAGGDLVIANGAIRCDGTSREYLPEEYPAVSDFDVTLALKDAAEALSTKETGNTYHIGVVQSKDSFYGQIEPETMPIAEHLQNRWAAYVRSGCLVSEMEAATLFSVAIARGVRAGAVFAALWNLERTKAGLPDPVCKDTDRAIRCAVNAIKLLIEKDRENV